MNSQNNGHEHELEPEFGLPEPLPRGETILWQGSPDFFEMAVRVFHLRKAVLYFLALLLAHAAHLWMSDLGLLGTLTRLMVPTLLAISALAAILTLAWLTARTTAYTLTDQRVVMRVGIVLTLTFNLPLKSISTAALQLTKNDFGSIPLALAGDDRIAWLHLWPHTRPWHVAKPEPMLRCLPDATVVASLLSKAWAAATGNHEALAKPALRNSVASSPQPSHLAQAHTKPTAPTQQWEATLT